MCAGFSSTCMLTSTYVCVFTINSICVLSQMHISVFYAPTDSLVKYADGSCSICFSSCSSGTFCLPMRPPRSRCAYRRESFPRSPGWQKANLTMMVIVEFSSWMMRTCLVWNSNFFREELHATGAGAGGPSSGRVSVFQAFRAPLLLH